MYLAESPEQESLRKELRSYFAELISDDERAELRRGHEASPLQRDIFRRLGRDGMLGIGWPKEYGGQGRPPTDQYIFFDEAQRASCPLPFVTLNTVGPTLMEWGSDDLKERFLPGILSGDIIFAIGYTEPGAGTDLAALQTRAMRDGDEYVVNGQKVFTSGGNEADYIWLACRTNPDVKKHKGISIIIVPTDDPGFSWTPIVTVGDGTTTATYYDDVRVPAENLVAEENGGWKLITSQLNHERVGLAVTGNLAFRLYDEVVDWASEALAPDGGTVLELPWVQAELAWCKAHLAPLNLLNWRMTTAVAAGELKPAMASAVKVYGTETVPDVYHRLLGIVGAAGTVRPGGEAAILGGELETAGRRAQINTFGGGGAEIPREIVAWMGLGMTRTAR